MQRALEIEPGVVMAYAVDDCTEPWRTPETVVLVHGLAESGEAWRAWLPHLVHRYRVVRLDQRGYGRSTPMREDFRYTLDLLAADLEQLVAASGARSVHLVGAKIGATVCAHFAASHPSLVHTLTLIGLPVKGPKSRADWIEYIRGNGVRAWARQTMVERRGGEATPAMLDGWSDLMARTAPSTLIAFMASVGGFDVIDDLPRIACPVLAVTSDSKRHPVAEAQAWRAKVPRSELVVIPGDGYHASAVRPDECARAVLEFVGRHPIG
jgi:pimeloyl-ACP methyl ester carboxylesterase